MSYDREIGFNLRDPRHIGIIHNLGITPSLYQITEFLPCNTREPEPKLLVGSHNNFKHIRNLIAQSPNAAILPDQVWEDKFPLVSVLLDDRRARISQAGYNLRFRFEINPVTGEKNKGDFNEKSCNAHSQEIGGLIDRFEREREVMQCETLAQGFQNFKNKYDNSGGLCCNHIEFKDLLVYAGYITSRAEYAFVVKHPEYPFAIVFEACEDVTRSIENRPGLYSQSYFRGIGTIYREFEFEAKKLCGDIPDDLRGNPEAFKLTLYSFMRRIQESIHEQTLGSSINMRSKAQIAQDHLFESLKRQDMRNPSSALAIPFHDAVKNGSTQQIDAIKLKLEKAWPLEDVLNYNRGTLLRNAQMIHAERAKLSSNGLKSTSSLPPPQPSILGVGLGQYIH